MRKTSTCFLSLFMLFVFLAYSGCSSKTKEAETFSPAHKEQLAEAFEGLEIIGEGTNFLTAKIDLAQTLSPGFKIYALVLDEDGYPMPKVSGYTHDPQLEGRDHLWFYFFLYAPGKWPAFLSKSGFIRFIVAKEDSILLEKDVGYRKTWGAEEVKIFDQPSPPDEIPGCIVLKDYTFLAQDDYRKPEGYYVEGKIIGQNGEWIHFMALSGIQGQEEEPEIKLETDRGWLELTTGKSHSMPEAITPAPPYVQGWWDGKGYFHPDPVRVFGLRLK
jgi:hypothetical protein